MKRVHGASMLSLNMADFNSTYIGSSYLPLFSSYLLQRQ
jgi:hypothetical protein